MSHDEHHGMGHVVPLRIMLAVGAALLFLTWVTVAIEKFDLGELNIFAALAVAVVKGTLVALYFMHLRWDRPFNLIVFIGGLAFVGLFIGFALLDTAEYQHQIIPGDTQAVTDALTAAAEEAAKHGGVIPGDAH